MAATMAGCSAKAGTPIVTCTPPCPTGTRCTEDGCLAEAGPPDLGASADAGDLAATCAPACGGATPYCNSSLQCVPCLLDDHCPAGQLCRAAGATSSCVPGCRDDARCGGAPLRCCGGACVDTGSDPAHCGACGTACMTANGSSVCSGGACQAGACSPGWGDCNADATDGCETNLRVTPTSCTACDRACAFANASAGCADGCYIAACTFGFDDCDGQPANGCEVSVLSDDRNCGACGQTCPGAPHARFTCKVAACRLSQCDAGFADCDGAPGNGCEVPLGSDPKNCGACGNACAQGLVCKVGQCTCPQCNIPNAAARCVNNVCLIDRCNVGFTDCDGQTQNGCEANTFNDPANCGGCNVVCPMDKPTCDRGTCSTIPAPIIHWDAADPASYAGQGAAWKDLSGHGVDGTLINNIQWGKLAGVTTFVFDGAGAGVTFPNASLDENTFGGVYWVYSQVPMAVADQGGLYVNWTQRNWNPPNWVAFFKWAVDDWYFRVNDGNCCQDLPGSGKGGFAKAIPQNQWLMVHFFYSIGAKDGWKWGVNGQNVTVSTINGRSAGQSEPTSVVGWGHPMQGGYWIGGIASVRFYDVLLGDAELDALFQSTKAAYGL